MLDFTIPTVLQISDAQRLSIENADRIVSGIVGVPDSAKTFENTLLALEEVSDLLERAQGRFGFMSFVAEGADTRDAADELREGLEKYEIELGFREDLYQAVTKFAESAAAQALEGESKRLLDQTLRDFNRNGFGLPSEERGRVRELKQRLVELNVAFQRNVDQWDDAILVTRDELSGLPEAYIENLRTGQSNDVTLYRVSLDYPEMYPFLDNAESEPLRRALMIKNYLKGGSENLPVLEEAIDLRDELASLLGYDSWAAYVVELRMAKTTPAIDTFLTDLRQRIEPKLRSDLDGLREAKREHTGEATAEVELWDWRFYHNYLLRTRFAVDDFEVAKYFPLDAVLEGLFGVTQTMLGVRFEAVEPANAWHTDVKLFRVLDQPSGEELAFFFMDLFPRPNKFGHAAAFTLVGGRSMPDGAYQQPVSAIVANFTKPTADQPSLLRHTEVITLFHEFGHILHQTLTRASRLHFSGTRTETDFVEAPSQMLEHWVWQSDVLAGFSRHVDSGEPLPQLLLDSMIAAKNLDSGVMAMRQLYFAELDMAYHAAGRGKNTTEIASRMHNISGFEAPADTHWQSGFGHLFGYDAGYYGYKWSEVYADDMFTRFEAAGPLDSELGNEYRQLVLERGGAVDGDVLVRDFLGREPNSDAFLRHMGL